MCGIEHAVSFLALIDGEPVGGGAIFMRRGLALFAGAATLPVFRNRGVHAVLHHVRFAHARAERLRRCGTRSLARKYVSAQRRAPRAPGGVHASPCSSGSRRGDGSGLARGHSGLRRSRVGE